MRYFNQFIIITGLFFSSFAHAVEFYADFLYWQASETVDWALTNNLSLPNQTIAYKTINFNFAPGFRIGAMLEKADWNGRVLYTKYNVTAKEATSGNVVSTFMNSKFVQKFNNSADVNFKIDFNMFDFDLYKQIKIDEHLLINPLIGLKGGWINQNISAAFQGQINDTELLANNFSGAGPKVGVESKWSFYNKNDYQYSLIANFSSSFMWGKWVINDSLSQSNSDVLSYLLVGKRDFGSLEIEGLVGINLSNKNYGIKIGYEFSDWFNQYQVFDNGTGSHTNDLVLQGLVLSFSGKF